MTRRRTRDVLDGALEDFERLVELGGRFQRVGATLRGINERRQRAQLGADPIHMVEVAPGVYQSARQSKAEELLEDAKKLRDALRPEIPDAIVTNTGRRR